MSDPTIDLIRRANPYPDGVPPLPIDVVKRRLRENDYQPATRRRIPRPTTGAVMVLASVLVALAIGAAVLTAGGPGHPTRPAGHPPVPSSRQQLLQTLGVLRRHQTPTDLKALQGVGGQLPDAEFGAGPFGCPPVGHAQVCTLRLDTSLVRVVDVGEGYRAAIFPAIMRPTPRAHGGERVVISLRGPLISGQGLVDAAAPATVQTLRSRGVFLSAYATGDIDRGVMLVPDGVTQITLDDFRLLAPHAISLPEISPATAMVSDNLALLTITGINEQNLQVHPTVGPTTGTSAAYGCQTAIFQYPATAEMTWFNHAHTAVQRITITLRLSLVTHRHIRGMDPPPPGFHTACAPAP